MRDDPSPNFWHTTRPHDDDCQARRVGAAQEQKPMPPCLPHCRVGKPWATLRLDGEITTEKSSHA